MKDLIPFCETVVKNKQSKLGFFFGEFRGGGGVCVGVCVCVGGGERENPVDTNQSDILCAGRNRWSLKCRVWASHDALHWRT